MYKDSIYKRYIPEITPPKEKNACAWWFIFDSNNILVKLEGERAVIPFVKDLSDLSLKTVRTQYLGLLGGSSCYSVEAQTGIEAPEGMEFRDLRSLFGLLDEDVFLLAGRALQIVNWDQAHQFCGRCGTPTETMEGERAKLCPKCGFMSYPRISPAVIVAIIRDDRILLAHSTHYRGAAYSIIAGFVEAGETLEDCVKREVAEEVGISIKNIKYFGNQTWPFPNSLMIGFTAEYEGGEICVDGSEIDYANWYSSDNMPEIPPKISIARRIIDWFIENY